MATAVHAASFESVSAGRSWPRLLFLHAIEIVISTMVAKPPCGPRDERWLKPLKILHQASIGAQGADEHASRWHYELHAQMGLVCRTSSNVAGRCARDHPTRRGARPASGQPSPGISRGCSLTLERPEADRRWPLRSCERWARSGASPLESATHGRTPRTRTTIQRRPESAAVTSVRRHLLD